MPVRGGENEIRIGHRHAQQPDADGNGDRPALAHAWRQRIDDGLVSVRFTKSNGAINKCIATICRSVRQ